MSPSLLQHGGRRWVASHSRRAATVQDEVQDEVQTRSRLDGSGLRDRAGAAKQRQGQDQGQDQDGDKQLPKPLG